MSLRVKLVIDSLGSGGAQRQLSTLAVLLKKRGLEVSVLTYHPHDFFLPMLRDAGVGYECVYDRSRARRARGVVRALRRGEQDVVLAFLDVSCLYAELAALPTRRWGLVVSERLAVPGSSAQRLPWKRWLHTVADCVVTNSHTNRLMIERAVPSLSDKLVTIYNAVDLDLFRPQPDGAIRTGQRLRIVAAASHQPKKNLRGLVEAMAIVRQKRPSCDVAVDWYGSDPLRRDGQPDERVRVAALNRIRELGLDGCFRLHPVTADLATVYRSAAAVVLPSLFEGLPNVVCEALACSRPVLMSDVCDAGNLVRPRWNGFLFDPTSPADMARAILEFGSLSISERETLGVHGRALAETIFDPARFANHYCQVIEAAARRIPPAVGHWLPDVPPAAYRPSLAPLAYADPC